MMWRLRGFLLFCGTVHSQSQAQATQNSKNMNGRYSVASGGRQDVPFNDDYASKGHEYFDIWSKEIATHYGEVFWKDQGNVPLPEEIVKRFDGKAIAITGYEFDQVMVQPVGHPGENPKEDVSVPINWAYNHHYMMWFTGRHSTMKKVPADHGDHTAHGADFKWIAVDTPTAALRQNQAIPTSQVFSEGNGGEARKSFHGYPSGYAQILDSPTSWHLTPMHVDTRNRDCGVTPEAVHNCTRFTPGPEPRQARFGRGIPKGTNHSGLLECPCTSRFGGDPVIYGNNTPTKRNQADYAVVTKGVCSAAQQIDSASKCFSVVPGMGIHASRFLNETTSDPKLPEGCSVVTHANGSATAYYNTGGKAPCAGGSKREGVSTESPVGVQLSVSLDGSGLFKRSAKGKYCSHGADSLLRAFPVTSQSLKAALTARDQCERYCYQEESCWGCSAACPGAPLLYGVLGEACQWNAIGACGSEVDWSGSIEGDISRKKPGGGLATITVSGPAEAWFGVALNAHMMCDMPYALIVNDQGVQEQKLGTCGDEGCHCGGTTLKSSVSVVSNTVRDGRRTVTMTRPLQGLTKDHYSFDPTKDQTLSLLTAVGNSQAFAYHKAHGPAEISLTATEEAACVCNMNTVGAMCLSNGKGCKQFKKNCVPAPSGELATQKNPTCSAGTYIGGLQCCGGGDHGRILLDEDQEVRPELLRFHLKYRIWFEEYEAKSPQTGRPSHYNLARYYYLTEMNAGEYDIPPAFAKPGQPLLGYPDWPQGVPTPGTSCTGTCPDGPDCECIHTLTSKWTVSNVRLLYAGGHCHAPSCVSLELYRNDTGVPQLICRQLPKYGKGNVLEDKFDEAGFLALPPCLWGDDPGLEPSVLLPPNTPMVSVKKNRNTYVGHFGEMASWQMRGVDFPAADPFFI